MQENQSAPDASDRDLKEEATREPKAPPRTLQNGRIVREISVRHRLTQGLAKKQSQQWLIETYESVSDTLARVRDGETQLGPATLARMKKIYAITRAELKRRGATDEELDYQPEAGEEAVEAEQPMEVAA